MTASEDSKPIKWRGKFGRSKKLGQDLIGPVVFISGVPTRDLTLLEFQQLEPATQALVVSSGLYEAAGEAAGVFNSIKRPSTQARAAEPTGDAGDSPGSKE